MKRKGKKCKYPKIKVDCPEEVFRQFAEYWVDSFKHPQNYREQELLKAFQIVLDFVTP